MLNVDFEKHSTGNAWFDTDPLSRVRVTQDSEGTKVSLPTARSWGQKLEVLLRLRGHSPRPETHPTERQYLRVTLGNSSVSLWRLHWRVDCIKGGKRVFSAAGILLRLSRSSGYTIFFPVPSHPISNQQLQGSISCTLIPVDMARGQAKPNNKNYGRQPPVPKNQGEIIQRRYLRSLSWSEATRHRETTSHSQKRTASDRKSAQVIHVQE